MNYNQPNITIHVEDISYKADGVYDVEYPEGIEVNVFRDKDITQIPIESEKTNQNGDAIINFYGEITITQNKSEQSFGEDLFIYQIIDEQSNIVSEILLSQGESETVKLPYGIFTVKKK